MPVVTSAVKTMRAIKSSEKWTLNQQCLFLNRLSELLAEGFSISEAISFLKIMMVKQESQLDQVVKRMASGESFPSSLSSLGFSADIITQLHFSIRNGQLIETLSFCASQMKRKQSQSQQAKKVIAYPSFLILLATLMMIAIRHYLLPTLEISVTNDNKWGIIMIIFLEKLPYMMCSLVFIVLLVASMLNRYLNKKSAYDHACFLIRMPIFGKWYSDYYTFYFSRELGYALLNGQSIYQFLEMVSSESTNQLLRELADLISTDLLAGDDLPTIMAKFPIFRKELTWIIYHGQLTSQLGKKLKLFSQECYQQLMTDIERKINYLQPVLFLFIGLIIVLIYGILMYPMLSMMKGMY